MEDLYPQSFWGEKSNADRGTSCPTVKTFYYPSLLRIKPDIIQLLLPILSNFIITFSIAFSSSATRTLLCSLKMSLRKVFCHFPQPITNQVSIKGHNLRRPPLSSSYVTGEHTFSHQYWEEVKQQLDCGPQQLPHGINLQYLPLHSFGQDIKSNSCHPYSLGFIVF